MVSTGKVPPAPTLLVQDTDHWSDVVAVNGPLTATTSIQWSVAWTSNVGAGGTFPVLTTASQSSFLVEQIQVVIK